MLSEKEIIALRDKVKGSWVSNNEIDISVKHAIINTLNAVLGEEAI